MESESFRKSWCCEVFGTCSIGSLLLERSFPNPEQWRSGPEGKEGQADVWGGGIENKRGLKMRPEDSSS